MMKNTKEKMVSIIIPFFNNSEQDLALPLGSINEQQNVDFSKLDVHLVNDGGQPIELEKLNIFSNLDLHYHELPENVGPGLARQAGIDKSSGKYLMFMDSDDIFQGPTALATFFGVQKSARDHDLFVSGLTLQQKDGSYISEAPDSGFAISAVYGKWFRRSYLEKLDLRFSPELRFYEDLYLAGVARALSQDCVTMKAFTYLRLYKASSLSHQKNINAYTEHFVRAKRLQLEKISQFSKIDENTVAREILALCQMELV